MRLIKDLFNVNKLALKQTLKNIKHIPVLTLVFLTFSFSKFTIKDILNLLFRDSVFNGIVMYVVEILFLSSILSILNSIVKIDKFDFNDFKSSFTRYFGQIMDTYFIIYIFLMLVSFLGITNFNFSLIIGLMVFILKSVMFEQIYINNKSSIEAIKSSGRFLIENIFQWIPIMTAYIYIEIKTEMFLIFASNYIFLYEVIIYSLLLSFIYVYKGKLFNILNNSSIRKREFMSEF